MLRTATVVLAATLITGCTPRGRVAAGVVTLGASGLAFAAAVDDESSCDSCVLPNVLPGMGALTLAAFGAVLLVSGLIHEDRPHRYAPPPAPLPLGYGPPSAYPVPGSPAHPALSSREENRLAIQASVTARAGHCDATVLTTNRLAAIDRDLYLRLVATDADVAACVSALDQSRLR